MNYRLPLPPIEQLAALAASINTQRTAQGKIDMAIEIWQLAQQRIEHHSNVTAQAARSAEKFNSRLEGREVHDGMLLPSFLKALFPSSKPEDSMKWYRDFIADSMPAWRITEGKPPLTEAEMKSAVAENIECGRGEGIRLAELLAIQFLKHRNAAAKKAQSERGKKGAKKKHLEQKKTTKNGTSKTSAAPSKKNTAPSKENTAPTNKKRAASKQ
jgi:hypothetical protein